jgi:hypothetical protein
MEKKTTSSPALQGVKRKIHLKRRKKKARENFGMLPKKQKGNNLTLLDGKRNRLEG